MGEAQTGFGVGEYEFRIDRYSPQGINFEGFSFYEIFTFVTSLSVTAGDFRINPGKTFYYERL